MATIASRPGPTAAVSAFARRHPLTLFFGLAAAFTWWAWVWYRLDPGNVDAPMFPPGPFLAALVMLALVGGRPAIRAWLGKIVHWRVRPVWYAFVLLVPVALTFAAVAARPGDRRAVHRRAGGAGGGGRRHPVRRRPAVGRARGGAGVAGVRLAPADGRPQPLAAALVLGVLHVLWHLPLFGVSYDRDNGVPWAISVLAFSVVTAWVWTHTGGSLLLPMLMHASVNSVTFVWRWFGGPDQVRLWWIWAALWVVVAVAVVVVGGPQLGRDPATPVRDQGKP